MMPTPTATRRISTEVSSKYSSRRDSLNRSMTKSGALNSARNRSARPYSGTHTHEPSPRRNESASARLGARKNTHVRHTRWKTTIRESHAPGDQSSVATDSSRPSRRRTNRSMLSPAPCIPPHTTKVQLAPCHNPPSSIVSIRFRYVRRSPSRLPPSGMYK